MMIIAPGGSIPPHAPPFFNKEHFCVVNKLDYYQDYQLHQNKFSSYSFCPISKSYIHLHSMM